ncbi:alpha/beta fold hydrolase [Wenxinia marina]|uniref:Alpha/beta hydrolase family n=1 Tax=Wenxinia marina DSM 24838 TaxID=1123501 RepID=A0A0D0PEU2_9RHOB|nr:alpha/beta hydrolase [Wenxinia marina]KIQ69916.1 Alpha/beta hydrolase family [Wenxinia marina DSM 24838]GGL62180.1 alpha/beta hydrolase [Wenxinia marina]
MILFLHGAGVTAADLRPGTYPLLRRLNDVAGPGAEIVVPVLAGASAAEWMDAIGDAAAALGPQDAVVGHSHGGAMGLKWLAERAPGRPLRAFVGCAMPMWGAPDWDGDDYRLPDDLASAMAGVERIVLAQADDDDTVERGHLDLYAFRLPRAEVHRLAGGGHDLDTDAVEEALAVAAHSAVSG